MKPDDRYDASKRKFLGTMATVGALGLIAWPELATAQGKTRWNSGKLVHIIPTANHQRFLIKTSFRVPLAATPRLALNGQSVVGERTDSAGRFWRFDAQGLSPDTRYELQIIGEGGSPLCDPWPLKTFPAPDAEPENLRILSFTCAGGYDGAPLKDKTFFLEMAVRRRLLARGMSYQPDVVFANGDHIYWDVKTALNKPFAGFLKEQVWKSFGGALDLSLPMMHPRNADTYMAVCDYQIPGLYGTTLRSTPAFFVTDDHDNFENDEFDNGVSTMPPDSYGPSAVEQTQHMYYPEFLPDGNRPGWLPGSNRAQLAPGANTGFGAMRYGNLIEALMYDCRRWADYTGDHARLVPQWTEDWLVARTQEEDTRHLLHVPSLPFAYSSGKLGDWYPDLLDNASGRLTIAREKPGWQRGWFGQHQRLIQALAAQKSRSPVIVQGDFHASSAGSVIRSGELELARPVHVVTSGTLGTGDIPFPSSYRGIGATTSQLIGMEEALKPVEKNGFSIIDVTADKLSFSMFTWRPPQDPAEIETMQPTSVYEVPRNS